MMTKEFDEWNEVKKSVQQERKIRHFKEREIFYLKMGHNVGFEQNGKGENFVRPVIILKKFNKSMFYGVPLSSQIKEGLFYYNFSFLRNNQKNKNIALLSQMRLYSANRLLNKIGMISKEDFVELKDKLKGLLD